MFWLIIATLCAFFVKGLCGFANTLVFTNILSFTVNNINISPVELLLGYPSNFIMAMKERKSLELKIVVPVSLMRIVGGIPGVFFLKNIDGKIIKILFGVVVILIGIELLFRNSTQTKKKESKSVLITIGLISGVLCGLYGIGALLAAYMNRVTNDTKAFKGNISMVFFVENTVRIGLYLALGMIAFVDLKTIFILVPFMLISLLLGIKCSNYLDEKSARKCVIVMLMISGSALIFCNLH